MLLTTDQFIAESGWRLAKTMLDHPHQYTVRDLEDPDRTTAMGSDEFEWFAGLTLTEGVPKPWGSQTYRYLRVDGWEYWTMGNPTEETTVINRRAVSLEAKALLEAQVFACRTEFSNR